jgi:hypothetical protein
VPVGEQGDEQALDQLGLADDFGGELVAQGPRTRGGGVKCESLRVSIRDGPGGGMGAV